MNAGAATTASPNRASGEPYCSNCGYTLTGLTDSSKCPECGKPLVEVLVRGKPARLWGKRYQSKAKIFGWPVISIATGPHGDETRGHAKGLIAIGDIATGGIAIAAVARGVVAIGAVAIGIVSIGACSLGVIASLGSAAGSLLIATGVVAVGPVAVGTVAVGVIAQGTVAVGPFARGLTTAGSIANAKAVFERLGWLFGTWPPRKGNSLGTQLAALRPALVPLTLALVLSTVIAFVALFRARNESS